MGANKGCMFYYVVFVLTICVLEIQSQGSTITEDYLKIDVPENVTTCNMNFTKTEDVIRYYKKSAAVPQDIKCTWEIHENSSTNGTKPSNDTIFLVFEDLFLGPMDKIYVMSEGVNLAYSPITDFKEPGTMTFLTGKSNITLRLETANTVLPKMRNFQVQFYRNSACNHSFEHAESGTFRSPMYAENYTMPIKCSFQVAVPNKDNNWLNLWFKSVTFNKALIEITGSENKDGNYTADNFPATSFLAKDMLTIDFTIQNHSSTVDMFMANYYSVSNDCSSYNKLDTDHASVELKSPSADMIQYLMSRPLQHSLSCQWQLESDPGTTLSVSIKNATFPEAFDQLVIMDGPNGHSQVLSELDIGQKDQSRIIYSTGNQLWISASSLFVTKGFAVNIVVSQINSGSGGHLHNNGSVTVKNMDSSTYLLEVNPGQQVQLMLDNETKLSPGSSVNFYSDFLATSKPFATLLPNQMLNSVVSPTEKMAVVASSFKGSALVASFSGVEKGCFEFATGNGDTYVVNGNCNSTCAWTVQPQELESGDDLAFHFPSINLSGEDEVIIRKLDVAQTVVANLTSRNSLTDLWLPAATGAFIQITRSSNCSQNDTILKASYLVFPECQATLTPELGETLQVSSPNFPNHYPLGARCSWIVKKPKGAAFLLVTFKEVHLQAPDHTLELFRLEGGDLNKTTSLANFSGPTDNQLQDDVVVKDDVMLNFFTSFSAPLQSATGFTLDITVVEHGEVLTNSSGIVNSTGADGSLYAWLVNVDTITNKSIIQFAFLKDTNFTDLNTTLRVFDGPSLRSPVLEYNSTNLEVLSRTNTLIFLYKATKTPGPSFSLNYINFPCNLSLICDNHMCMHEEWHCNGVNDCGDYSDEKNCEGGLSPPTPSPPPTPKPSPSPNGASVGVFAGVILSSLVVGAMLGVAVPMAYRRYRDRQIQTYTSLNS